MTNVSRAAFGMRAVEGGLRHHHVLDLDDFDKEEIEFIFSTADGMREILQRDIKKVPPLRGKTMVTLFYEPSTRTRMSFELAAKMLSADVVNFTAQTSSAVKGESLVDTVRTILAMSVDIIVIRHGSSGAPYLVAQQCEEATGSGGASVINGGDGWHAHPTQALLDMYTMQQRFGSLEGCKVAVVGDVLHSRVARSNIWGLHALGAKVMLCAPPTLLPREWACEGAEMPASVTYDLAEALDGADVVMTLRLQQERMEGGLLPSLGEYIGRYQVNAERLAWAKPGALLMHPGPVNEGVELSADLVRGAQSVIDGQVTNGMAVRMALLYLLVGGPQ